MLRLLFHSPILCDVYSRPMKRCLLISVNLSLVPKTIPTFSMYTVGVSCGWGAWIWSLRWHQWEWRRVNLSLMTANCMLLTWASQATFLLQYCYNIMQYYRVTRFVNVCTCYSNSSHGYYLRAATISFSASWGAASIREWRLFESSVWCSEYGICSH